MKHTLLAVLLAFPGAAQVVTSRPFVRASGQASVSVPPDQVKIDVNVMTQGASAQEAAVRNSDQVTALLAALTKLLGPNADIKTISYFVGPDYRNSSIVDYSANSTVEVALTNLSLAGTVIDTSVQAGATGVGALRFGLQNTDPMRLQALRQATLQARAHADAMATGLGRTTGAVISVQEAGSNPILPIVGLAAPTAASTPVQPGLIEIQASVTLDVELQ